MSSQVPGSSTVQHVQECREKEIQVPERGIQPVQRFLGRITEVVHSRLGEGRTWEGCCLCLYIYHASAAPLREAGLFFRASFAFSSLFNSFPAMPLFLLNFLLVTSFLHSQAAFTFASSRPLLLRILLFSAVANLLLSLFLFPLFHSSLEAIAV